jgi:hypothetical protein
MWATIGLVAMAVVLAGRSDFARRAGLAAPQPGGTGAAAPADGGYDHEPDTADADD